MAIIYNTIRLHTATVPASALLTQLASELGAEFAYYTSHKPIGSHFLAAVDAALAMIAKDPIIIPGKRPPRRDLEAQINNGSVFEICSGFAAIALYTALAKSKKHGHHAAKADYTLIFDPEADPVKEATEYMEYSELLSKILTGGEGRKRSSSHWREMRKQHALTIGAKVKKSSSKAGDTVVEVVKQKKVDKLPQPANTFDLFEEVS